MASIENYKRNPDVSWRTIEGQAVLIHNRNGEIVVVNEVATRIWECLDQEFETIIRNICAEFEVGEDEARMDAEGFIQELIGAGFAFPGVRSTGAEG